MGKTYLISEQGNNPFMENYLTQFTEREEKTCVAIQKYGIDFESSYEISQSEREKLQKKLRCAGAHLENNQNSIYINKISPACQRCRTGQNSYTAFISLKCHRSCYFCFNPNQEQYDVYKNSIYDASNELEFRAKNNEHIDYIALTGGEPLLFKKEAHEFFSRSKKYYPQAHRRLYTSGDLLKEGDMKWLAEAGVDEIRFSIKIEDSCRRIENLLSRIRKAKYFFPRVMVEMPVIPGTEKDMQTLLRILNDIKIDSINLLEFCFPLHNASDFRARGLELKFPPWSVFHNYWYAGGIAVAGSENACLRLLLFALEEKLSIGVHYCSLENKYSGQIYQQNCEASVNSSYILSKSDYFFRTAKVFGNDKGPVRTILEKNGLNYEECPLYHAIQFDPTYLPLLAPLAINAVISICVSEYDGNGNAIMKELKASVIHSASILSNTIENDCNER